MNWNLENTKYFLDNQEIGLYELIKKLLIQAKKSKLTDEVRIYQTVLGEADRRPIGEESSEDSRLVKMIQNVIAGNNEVLSKDDTKEELKRENEILNQFVPQMWSEEETSDYVENTLKSEIEKIENQGKAIAFAVVQMQSLPAQKRDIALTVKKIFAEKG